MKIRIITHFKRLHISKGLTSCLWNRYLYLQQESVREAKSGRSRCMTDRLDRYLANVAKRYHLVP